MMHTEEQIKLLQQDINKKENEYDHLVQQNYTSFDDLKNMYFEIKSMKTQLKLLVLQIKKQKQMQPN